MKQILSTIALMVGISSFAQVAIGKTNVSKLSDGITNNPGISLEFYDSADNSRGIVLPWVSTVANNPFAYNATTGAGYKGMNGIILNGTIVYDLSDKKIKYRKNGSWEDLTDTLTFPLTVKNSSNQDGTITGLNAVDSSLQDNVGELSDARVAIGTDGVTDTASGILALTDKDKAMVLPKVASPHLTIKNPAPGMMAYDTVKKQLAVCNGTVWSFWKP